MDVLFPTAISASSSNKLNLGLKVGDYVSALDWKRKLSGNTNLEKDGTAHDDKHGCLVTVYTQQKYVQYFLDYFPPSRINAK